MKITLFTLVTPLLLSTLFLGCATKTKPTLACFKGSTSCITQIHQEELETCSTCRAII